ncbi:MAG: sugar ABC transporter ATP-binding protein [Planctomycetes bacterium]|jgi:ribose transport system ATP-binding protein|nr:sugar ABC transporter ATP-binding protein [Planctomycetota bacterium]
MTTPLLEVLEVGKSFAGVPALRSVSLQLHRGEVVALIGENGAGKSTLMKVLAGVHRPDTGSLRMHGRPLRLLGPRDALQAGIALIHQELSLCDNLTVTEALFLGRELQSGPFLRRRAMAAQAAAALRQVGLEVPPHRLVSSLAPGQQQLLEIARALARRAEVLIFDEPTSSLTEPETQRLLAVVRELQARGAAIVWITHRMAEVQAVAGRVIALRDGEVTGEIAAADATHERMVAMMVGRTLRSGRRTAHPPGAVVLTVRGLRTRAFPAAAVDLELRAGEVVGIAGLLGSGRSELLRAMVGADRAAGGRVRCGEVELVRPGPAAALRAGLVLVPEDRKRQGLVLDSSNAENLSLPTLRGRGVFVDRGRERQQAVDALREFGVAARGPAQPTRELSGGNQQKIAIGRWLLAGPRVLLLDEPSRGVDVGARADIYARLHELAGRGMAILFVSSELPEVLALADRVLVLHEGRLAGELPIARCTEAAILALATGQVPA